MGRKKTTTEEAPATAAPSTGAPSIDPPAAAPPEPAAEAPVRRSSSGGGLRYAVLQVVLLATAGLGAIGSTAGVGTMLLAGSGGAAGGGLLYGASRIQDRRRSRRAGANGDRSAAGGGRRGAGAGRRGPLAGLFGGRRGGAGTGPGRRAGGAAGRAGTGGGRGSGRGLLSRLRSGKGGTPSGSKSRSGRSGNGRSGSRSGIPGRRGGASGSGGGRQSSGLLSRAGKGLLSRGKSLFNRGSSGGKNGSGSGKNGGGKGAGGKDSKNPGQKGRKHTNTDGAPSKDGAKKKGKGPGAWAFLKALLGFGAMETPTDEAGAVETPTAPDLPVTAPQSAPRNSGPDQRTQSVPTTGGGTNMGAIADSAEGLMAAVGKVDLTSARNLEAVFTDLGAFEEQVAKAKRALAGRITEEFPADPGVADMVHRQAAQQAKFAESANEVKNHFRRAHQGEWERLENPRTNEQAWDHQTNNQE